MHIVCVYRTAEVIRFPCGASPRGPETGFEEVGRIGAWQGVERRPNNFGQKRIAAAQGQDSRLRSEIQVCQLSKRLSVTASR
jgi:hypothetical protein